MKKSNQAWKMGFQVAVSARLASPPDAAASGERRVFFYAERNGDGLIFLQTLNENGFPSGDKQPVSLEEFLNGYTLEPLYFYHRIKPALETVAVNLEKGERHLKDNQLGKAESAFRKVLDVDEENIRGIFGLGITCLRAGKTDQAQSVFQKIMALDLAFGPEHTHLFNMFGIQMRKAGMLRQAAAYYEKAIGLNANDEHLFFNASRSHFENNDMFTSYTLLARALHLNPEFSEGKRMLCAILKSSGLTLEQLKLESLKLSSQGKDNVGLDLDGAAWLLE